jgi:hypothetical protein
LSVTLFFLKNGGCSFFGLNSFFLFLDIIFFNKNKEDLLTYL